MKDKRLKNIYIGIISLNILILIIMLSGYYVVKLSYYNSDFELVGSKNVSISYGSVYDDEFVVAKYRGEDVTKDVKIENNVDTSKLGNYTVKYTLTFDKVNVSKTLIRNVNVVDTEAPIITTDNDEINVIVNTSFEIPNYTAVDNIDGDLTSDVKVESNVSSTEVGDYQLTLISIDKSGNKTIKNIPVHVKNKKDLSVVKVSIDNQKLEYYENGELILSCDIVTGKNNATPRGNYQVLGKARNTTLKGQDYSSFVKYWIAFKGNSYGLHDASWRSTFGGNIYKYNGSHGCVNMPEAKVAKLYNIVEIGTPVIVS